MSHRIYRQCARCVMDTSDPAIEFDAQGRCNHCTAYLTMAAARVERNDRSKAELEALLSRIKARGARSRYDCVAGVSGGGDSSYVAYLATKLGLRVLAVHLDNGWDTAVAVRNVKRLVDGLGLDYVSVVLDWHDFRDVQLAFFRASVPEIETPTDIAIPGALHQVAAEHGVRTIIGGGNIYTEGILPRAWHYNAKDTRYLRAIHARFGSGRALTLPTFDYRQEAYYKLVRGIQIVYPLEYVPVTNAEIVETLRREIGWQRPGGKHHESVITRFVQSYVLPLKFGFDYRRATLSTQICAGELTREAALAALEGPPYDVGQVSEDRRYVAKKLGITADELDRLIARSPRSHADYPNDEAFLEGLYGVYRRVVSPALRAMR